MLTIGGFGFLLACVFGSYAVSGGSIGVLAEALPHEMMTIGGAAVGRYRDGQRRASNAALPGRRRQRRARPQMDQPEYWICSAFSIADAPDQKTKGTIALKSHIEKPSEARFSEVSCNSGRPFRPIDHL